jgi:hypothetical protein
MRASALSSKSGALWGRAFLEHDADDVNDFLIQASVAMQDPLIGASVCQNGAHM